MNTLFLLMAQYEGAAIVSLECVCKDYFSHLTPEKFQRKVLAGEIDIPIVRMEKSQKSAKGVHLKDLAAYLDAQCHLARRENDKLHGRGVRRAG